MKLKGQAFPAQEILAVQLSRGDSFIEVKVSGFPLGVHQDYSRVWPRPIAPITVFNTVGKPPENVPNTDDPSWQKEIAAWRYHQNIYIAYRGLLASGEVQFDSTADTKEGIIALVDEFRKAGLSEGDVGLILKGIKAASHIDDAAIQAEKKTF